jgi:hypothetical protein
LSNVKSHFVKHHISKITSAKITLSKKPTAFNVIPMVLTTNYESKGLLGYPEVFGDERTDSGGLRSDRGRNNGLKDS